MNIRQRLYKKKTAVREDPCLSSAEKRLSRPRLSSLSRLLTGKPSVYYVQNRRHLWGLQHLTVCVLHFPLSPDPFVCLPCPVCLVLTSVSNRFWYVSQLTRRPTEAGRKTESISSAESLAGKVTTLLVLDPVTFMRRKPSHVHCSVVSKWTACRWRNHK